MAQDDAHKNIVLFGGTTIQGSSGKLGDTWIWNGVAWSEKSVVAPPPSRYGHGLAFDPKNATMLLLSGRGINGRDFWDWQGTSWLSRTASPLPTAMNAPLASDTTRGIVVLFGGVDSMGNSLDETWEWDGASWTKKTPPVSPPARGGHVLVYDSDRRGVVLVGGAEGGGTYFDDTWEYDGMTWEQKSPPHRPLPTAGGCAAFDPSRGVTVLFGGHNNKSRPPHAQTFEWDGNDWTTGKSGPPARRSCAMAFDATSQRVVMFGGAMAGAGDAGRYVLAGDTWLY